MECVALDVERLHLGIADFDTPFVGGGVERAFDLQAALVRPMILFQNVVEILHRSMPAILLQSLLDFEPHDGR
jgi:hypothetical protein